GWAAIEANRATVDNIRLWDHRPLQTTFQQMQGLRSYYHFTDVDVDRYTVQGKYRQVMLSGRQINYAGINRPTWVSQHLLYTHGYGLCLSPVNEISGDGLPRYWVKDFPVTSDVGLEVTRPQLYYYASTHPRLIEYISGPETPYEAEAPAAAPAEPGPGGPPQPGGPTQPAARRGKAPQRRGPAVSDVPYVIVNTDEMELDYPRGKDGEGAGEGDNATTRYQGQGDVQLSSFWRRFCFFMRYRDLKILLTESIKPDSRILFNRALPERLMALAPIMGYDPDPYLVIAADGKLKWINDAYTATNMYPYSARVPWFGANYVRNSVKVVTDAYEGVPEFYVMSPGKGQKPDPIVECWRKVFPSLFKDLSAMPEDLRKHLRYPQLLFRIQAEIYGKYHMTDPQTFFQKEDQWAIPPEVYSNGQRDVEAFYVNMKLPHGGSEREEFLLMQPFTLAKREDKNMVGWMAARCDEPNYGELIVYDFPKSSLIQGPMQVESRISQDAEISQLITLWGQQQSQIIRGNLLVIPIADSLLYVEPFYLEAPNSPYPQLKLVVMAYNDKIVNAPTLEGALRKLFGQTSGAAVTTAPVTPPTLVTPSAIGGTLKQLLQQAVQLDQEAQQALSRGDLAGYQAKQQQQSEIIKQAEALAK
ncbi:MAG: COG1615 family transporter, partial [Armatimonadetes bacterium]|nr:COG1615 family transporter [Armatimonadota bacterium]